MTQDYAKPSTTRKPGQAKKKNGHTDRPQARDPQRKNKRKNIPSIPEVKPRTKSRRSLFVFSLLSLIVAFGYGLYLLQTVPETHSLPSEETKIKEKPSVKTEKKTQKEPENRFNFYDLLPKNEVIAPKVDAYQFKEKSAPGEFYYIIQTGSFRNLKDAERQKAMIAFQGLKADIRSITNEQGSTWHRVSTGPFYNRSKMNSALDKLVSMQIQPLVKKIKVSS
ncbi:MAG: cell division protein FtsN [Oleiphilaceae bacterium]|jgi:cell division protein FtsN